MTTDNRIVTPPPLPPEYRRPVSYGYKVLLLGLMSCVLMLGVLAVWIISYSRNNTNEKVAESIVSQWGSTVYIQGPAPRDFAEATVDCRPAEYNCEAQVTTKSLHRGIYEAEVFTADVNMSGVYDRNLLQLLGDTLVFELDVPTDQLLNYSPLKIGGKECAWSITDNVLSATVDLSGMPEEVEFSTGFEVRGSEALFVDRIGLVTNVSINGKAHNPSFTGSSLPVERSARRGRFEAKWEDRVSSDLVLDDYNFVGTNFLVGVDRYRMVDRSMKYSFIIIILTFISALFVEIMRRHPIPLLNYFLIGAALIIFYSLLLSFVELVPFGVAYLIASVMTVALITGYMWKMLSSRKIGLSIGGILSLMYLFCYILLNLSTFALLFGSLLLFCALAAMMYASLKLPATSTTRR